MIAAISAYVSQNFGAGNKKRIRLSVRACLIQTEALNLIMCLGILFLRHPIVELFLSNPTAEIYSYSDQYLTSLLLSFGITVHLPGICTKYGKWLGSIYCLYD